MEIDELIKAASEIKEICLANDRCKGCPFSYVFYGENYCKFEDEEGSPGWPWEWSLQGQIECEEDENNEVVEGAKG
jgi:hypothetical protein